MTLFKVTFWGWKGPWVSWQAAWAAKVCQRTPMPTSRMCGVRIPSQVLHIHVLVCVRAGGAGL